MRIGVDVVRFSDKCTKRDAANKNTEKMPPLIHSCRTAALMPNLVIHTLTYPLTCSSLFMYTLGSTGTSKGKLKINKSSQSSPRNSSLDIQMHC